MPDVGDILGRYTLLAKLAVGGMGEIFLASRAGPLGFGPPVALKVLREEFASDGQFIEMLVDEAKISRFLNHQNVVTVLDFGEEDDTYYIAMEFVQGMHLGGLEEVLRKHGRRCEIALGLYIATELCRALKYAHTRKNQLGEPLNIIHRDVTPGNVLLSIQGEVKLTDFGIARAKGRSTQTQAGVLKGKFGYMAPEMLRYEELDARADLFCVGVAIYELLAGRHPVQGASVIDAIEAFEEKTIVPPSKWNPQISPQLDAVLMKALEPRPGDRWSTASDLGAAFQELALRTEAGRREVGAGAAHLSALMRELAPEVFQSPVSPQIAARLLEETRRREAQTRSELGMSPDPYEAEPRTDEPFRPGYGPNDSIGDLPTHQSLRAIDDDEDPETLMNLPRRGAQAASGGPGVTGGRGNGATAGSSMGYREDSMGGKDDDPMTPEMGDATIPVSSISKEVLDRYMREQAEAAARRAAEAARGRSSVAAPPGVSGPTGPGRPSFDEVELPHVPGRAPPPSYDDGPTAFGVAPSGFDVEMGDAPTIIPDADATPSSDRTLMDPGFSVEDLRRAQAAAAAAQTVPPTPATPASPVMPPQSRAYDEPAIGEDVDIDGDMDEATRIRPESLVAGSLGPVPGMAGASAPTAPPNPLTAAPTPMAAGQGGIPGMIGPGQGGMPGAGGPAPAGGMPGMAGDPATFGASARPLTGPLRIKVADERPPTGSQPGLSLDADGGMAPTAASASTRGIDENWSDDDDARRLLAGLGGPPAGAPAGAPGSNPGLAPPPGFGAPQPGGPTGSNPAFAAPNFGSNPGQLTAPPGVGATASDPALAGNFAPPPVMVPGGEAVPNAGSGRNMVPVIAGAMLALAVLVLVGLLLMTDRFWPTMNINTNPMGARVFLDGQDTGARTPVSISVKPWTAHELELKADGYMPLRHGPFEMGPMESQDLGVKFKPAERAIQIGPVPGKLFINDTQLGEGADLKLPKDLKGRVELKVEAEGHEPWTRVFGDADEIPARLEVSLTPKS